MIRANRHVDPGPLAITAEQSNMQVITALNADAEEAGLYVGQPLRDAHAICASLVAQSQNAPAEAAFLMALRRWAGKFSPWVAEEPPAGLVIDLTGCAHLFGGEPDLLSVLEADCADMGLSVRLGIADTVGAAWALARFAGQPADLARNGDAIDQEARATRARAGKRRHWTKGGTPPQARPLHSNAARIAPPGQTYGALGPLPIAALRLEPEAVTQLTRLGLRRIADLLGQPRASLARRFGKGLVLRLDQAMGSAPEPVSPARPAHHFATRLTLPDPIGLQDDVMAGIDRLLPRLCAQLADKGRAARLLRLDAFRTDQTAQTLRIGLARPTRDPTRIRPLIALKIDQLDAGFGIDMLRLEACHTEPLHSRTKAGHLEATENTAHRLNDHAALDDLIGKLGARIGLDAITRHHPAASHIPEKTAKDMAAAWSDPAPRWPPPSTPRPLRLWPPEPITTATEDTIPPTIFRWRGRNWHMTQARGPERIAPEWWLDDPTWRSGLRDYWVMNTQPGDCLWVFYGHGAALSSGWFCHGTFG